MSLKLLMNWLAAQRSKDASMPPRFHKLQFLEDVLDGKQYDELEFEFYKGKDQQGQYISLRKRVPSVQAGMCEIIVNDSTSLLFSQDHFPTIICENQETQQVLSDLIEEKCLQFTMLQAAIMGSIGSVAIEVMVLEKQMFFNLLKTKTLTPVYDPRNPDRLLKVTQKYKVHGADLADSGLYSGIVFDHVWYFSQAEWTPTEYIHYTPYKTSENDEFAPSKYEPLSETHNLGIVPIVWIKNLPNIDPCAIDGAPTFNVGAIGMLIELDYQLSQVGRALTYSSDPMLVIKNASEEEDGTLIRSADNVLNLDEEGEAYMLEIKGKSSEAILEYARELRERIMERVRGNRTSPDKLAAATSGYAIELMNMSLVNLVKILQVTYGTKGLLPLLKMVCKISEKVPFEINGKEVRNIKIDKPLRLQWPPFYDDTESDKQSRANTLAVLTEASLLSYENARPIGKAIYNATTQVALNERNSGKDLKETFAPIPTEIPKNNSSEPGKTNAPKPKTNGEKK